jgi:hypothetical protein
MASKVSVRGNSSGDAKALVHRTDASEEGCRDIAVPTVDSERPAWHRTAPHNTAQCISAAAGTDLDTDRVLRSEHAEAERRHHLLHRHRVVPAGRCDRPQTKPNHSSHYSLRERQQTVAQRYTRPVRA